MTGWPASSRAPGARVNRFWLSDEFEALEATQLRVFGFEARQTLAHERLTSENSLSPRLQARLRSGEDVSLDEYVNLLQHVAKLRSRARRLFDDYDAILYPATEGEAETGYANTGSPRYGALWTLLHLPSISFPIDLGPSGLPLGAQLIGAYAQDTRLLAVAQFVTAAFEPVITNRQPA